MSTPLTRGKAVLLMLPLSFAAVQHRSCSSALAFGGPPAIPSGRATAMPPRYALPPDGRASGGLPAAGAGKRGGGDTAGLRAHEVATGQQLNLQQPKPQPQSQPKQDEEGFQWTRHWYPVAIMRDLEASDPRQPHAIQLLGEPLVVWKDPKDDSWKAFADKCPHRWAPLSEGRVDQKSGRLQCMYHGWEFEGDGKCGSIPQAPTEVSEAAQKSNRACATVVPTKVLEGKLWLWPDTSPEGVKESERVQPMTVPGLDLDKGGYSGSWYARDVVYGADTLIENLVDPAHIPFAHHGVMGNRAMGSPMAMEIDKAGSSQDEFVTNKMGFGGLDSMMVSFRAPALIYYESDFTEALGRMKKKMPAPVRAGMWALQKLHDMQHKKDEDEDEDKRLVNYFIAYATPTSPGKCRMFTRTTRKNMPQIPIISRFRNTVVKEHLAFHKVIDGDSPALHVQERFLNNAGERGVKTPEKTFYMPTDTDAVVRTFRNWYNSRAGGGPRWPEGVDPSDLGPILPHKDVIERFEAHTKNCSACSKAFEALGKLKRRSAGCTLLLLAAAAAAPRGVFSIGLATGAMASAYFGVAMSKRQQKFVFEDYVHADAHRD